jgi:demethylmenaquinone methyltransferase/2-methoxy-6-polyprenyl-1,4-benzoquinol methylase
MANEFYDPGAQRGEKVRALFDRIARRYDLINDVQSFGLHRAWKRKVIELAAVKSGNSALDVCCGTGDIAWRLNRAGVDVTGLDFSPEMLVLAAKRKPASSSIRFIQGDALKLPFADTTYDIVTIGYGLRNLASWEGGVTEMARVLKPGGRMVVLEFGRPDSRCWKTIYFAYLRMFVPVLGLIFCGNASAYAYILESLKHYPGQNAVLAKMQSLGLDASNINILGGAMSITLGVKRLS